ncbi:hypothetical protein [Pseudomonas sp. NPDC096950]|uniref:hypothetical protein n=1 Tax=Pseudomonas sp. NPDC096950 TaxID=3364485 RepID=UPI00383B17BF
MSNSLITAIVYIWYPDDGNIGHAAMYIGNPVFGRFAEQAYDSFRNDGDRARNKEFIELYNVNYISWWPDGGGTPINKLKQGRKFFLEEDVKAEGAKPHVVYILHGLNLQAMRSAWLKIRSKPDAHYQMLRKSCATVVLRVLKAGGALEKLSLAKRAWFSNNLYVSPKNIAQICTELRDVGLAKKVKDKNCPEKGSFSFGLR